MATYSTETTITTSRGDTLSATKTGVYEDVFNIRQEVDNTTNFIPLLNAGSKAQGTLEDCQSLIIRNAGEVGGEIQIHSKEWVDAVPDSSLGTASYQSYLLGAGDYIYLPNFRQVNFQAVATSAGNARQLTNQAPDSNLYTDSALDTNDGTGADITGSATETKVYIEQDGGTLEFVVGDLIRVNNEIMEVTEVGDDSDADNTYVQVLRGQYGSTAASDHADDAAIRFPFFNAYADFDKFSKVQTDNSGRFKCFNFFGYGRNTGGEAMGVVPGSFSLKFYEAGYQSLGLSGVTDTTKSGLSAGTTYQFNITVDGGSAFAFSFTVDSSNTNWGGTNGVIEKIQTALDAQYYTSGNLFEKKVVVDIVDGDIRFTSGQRLSTSAILLADSSGGDTDIWGVGRVPAVGSINSAVAAKLPSDTVRDGRTNVSSPNLDVFAYDDGHGNIKGACTGTINYHTGAIDFQDAPAFAEFVFDANLDSAHSGGNQFASTQQNCLLAIEGRSCNSKINTVFEVIGLK